MDGLSVAMSVLALAQTAKKVTIALQELVDQFKDAPSGIANLFSEHKLMSNCVERFKGLIERHEDAAEPQMRNQAKMVVADTQRTLEELHSNIKGLMPSKIKGKRSVLTIRCKYMWNEKPLQATLLRLQARRDAMSLLLNLWASADTARVRDDLAGIRRTLEDTLLDIRQQRTAPDTPNPPDTPSSSVDDDASVPGTWDSSISDPDDAPPRPSVLSLRNRFESSLKIGKRAGPAGQQIVPLTNKLNAQRTADARRPQPDLSPLIRELSATEAVATSLSSKESAAAAHALGKAYEAIEDYENALIYYHQGLAAREFLLGENDPATLSSIESIAACLQLQSQWNGALEYYLLLLSRRQENPKMKPDDPSILAARLNIARMHAKAGEHTTAIDTFRAVLAVYTAMPNGGSTKAIQIRAEIAGVQSQMGDYKTALAEYEGVLADWKRLLASREGSSTLGPTHRLTQEARRAVEEAELDVEKTRSLLEPCAVDTYESDPTDISDYKKALEAAQRAHGAVHPVTLDHMCNLAFAYASHEQYDTAIGWYKEAIQGWEKLHTSDHPSTLAAINSMAQSYYAKGDYPTALMHFHRVLTGREARGPDNPDTLNTIQEMGTVYASLNELESAISFLKKAEAGFLAKYGPTHEDTLQTQFDLADVYGLKKRHAESLTLHDYVLQTRLACLGDQHQWTLGSKHAVAVVCEQLGQHDRAILLYTEAVDGREQLLGKHHSTTQNSVLQLASLLWDTRQFESALKYYLWALESIQKREPENPGAGVVTMSNIAGCFNALKRHEEALDWYRKVHLILHTIHGAEDPKTIKALQNVAESCKDTERWAEAVDLLTRALEATERSLPEKTHSIHSMLFDLAWCTFQLNQLEASLAWSRRLCSTPDVLAERVLITRRRMGVIHIQQGRFEEAVETLLDVLEQASIHLAPDHWVVSRALEGLEEAYTKITKKQGALDGLQRQRDLIMARLDSGDSAAIGVLAALGDVHLEQNLYHEAVPMYETTLKAIEGITTVGSADLDVPTLKELDFIQRNTLVSLAEAHEALGNYTAAILYFEQRAEGEHGPGIRFDALARIASLHKENGDYQQALTTYLQLLGEQLELGPEMEIQANKTRRLVGTVYKQLGDLSEALRWYEAALEGFRCLSGGLKGKGKALVDLVDDTDSPCKAVVEVLITTNLMSTLYSTLGKLDLALEYRVEAAEGFERELGPDADATLAAALALAKMYKVRERRAEADVWYRKALRGYEAKLENNRSAGGGLADDVTEQIAHLKQELMQSGRSGST